MSPWKWDPIMRELTRWADGHGPAPTWTIARAVLPKRGERSVGVQRRFDPSSGRRRNCQLGLGVFLCIGGTQVPVDWRLLLPSPWTEDEQLRRRCGIPETEPHLPQWAHALELVDTLADRTLSDSATVVADMSDDPDAGLFLRGLLQRRRDFVIAVPYHLKVAASSFASHAPALFSARPLAYAGGERRSVRVKAAPVRLADRREGMVLGQPCLLFAEVTSDNHPDTVWITNLVHASVDRIVALAEEYKDTVATLSAMERDFGLHDFEGRSFAGWYHHMTLVSVAHAYRCLAEGPMPTVPAQRTAPDDFAGRTA